VGSQKTALWLSRLGYGAQYITAGLKTRTEGRGWEPRAGRGPAPLAARLWTRLVTSRALRPEGRFVVPRDHESE
jgi:hypothetical protein